MMITVYGFPCHEIEAEKPIFRRARQNIIVERLRKKIQEGEPYHRLTAAKVRELVLDPEFLVSLQEFGHAMKRAFPRIKRRRVHSCWYYYGIQEAGKTNGPIPQKEDAIPRMSQKCYESRKQSHSLKKGKEITSQNVENGMVIIPPFKIPSLNICCEDLAFNNKDKIGTGTFGRCYSGEYKGLPVAIKVFKGKQSFSSVHKEAEIMTKIPSHPNIALLIGVRTDGYPFMLVSKLCTINNNPQTYGAYIREHEINKTLSTSMCLPILCEMMSAICHIHERGILHNDIKSNNFVIEEREMKTRPVLIDFGKAAIASKTQGCEVKRNMTLAERHHYRQKFPHIAPEISLGKAQTELTGTYSFGYIFCTTMKSLDNMRKLAVGNERLCLLKVGQSTTHNNPKNRGNLQDALMAVDAITKAM